MLLIDFGRAKKRLLEPVVETQRDEVVSTNKALEKQKRELELALENLKLRH